MIKVTPDGNNPPLDRALILCAVLFVPLIVAALGLPRAALADGALNAPPTATARVDYLPATTLVDQTGKNFSLATVKGRPALVGFIHTSCQGPCELMTAKMKTVADDL